MFVLKPADIHDLNDTNFFLYAAKNYDNPQVYDMQEFEDDIQMPMHLKKLFTRYHTNKDLKERLILNHIICFLNVFPGVAGIKILFYKIEENYHMYLKTFLTFLDRCPEFVAVNGKIIDTKKIPNDLTILHRLKAVK